MSMHLLTETLLFGKSTAYAPVQTVIPGGGMHGDSVLTTLSLGRAVASCSIFVFFWPPLLVLTVSWAVNGITLHVYCMGEPYPTSCMVDALRTCWSVHKVRVSKYPRVSKDIHKYPQGESKQVSISIQGYPWVSMSIQRYPWVSTRWE